MDKVMKINEMFGSNDDLYVTELDDVSLYDIDLGEDKGMYGEKCKVYWKLDMQHGSYGVKDLRPNIQKIEMSYILEDFEDESEDEVEMTLTNDEFEFQISFESNEISGSYLSIVPQQVDIYYKMKKIEVIF
jgi:hypothetical protein